MKKQLRRNNEKKRLDLVDDNAFDMNISEISGSLDNVDKITLEQQAHFPLPSKPLFNSGKNGNPLPSVAAIERAIEKKLNGVASKVHLLDSNNIPVLKGRSTQSQSRSGSTGSVKGRNVPIGRASERPMLPEEREGEFTKSRKLFKLLNSSTKDCFVCNKKKSFKEIIGANLSRKYLTTRESYNTKVVNDIIYNETTHIVSVFKDYLIYDDISEFLKRFYAAREVVTRLPKIFDFYEKYSKVFPNYVILEEKKYMFKNISRKQRVIDEQQNRAEGKNNEIDLNEESGTDGGKRLFTSTILRAINKSDSVFDKSRKKEDESNTQLRSYVKSQPKGDIDQSADLRDISLKELLDKFIQKDSRSSIDINEVLKDFDALRGGGKDAQANVRKPEQKVQPKTILEKPLADGRVLHLRGKSANEAPVAALVRPSMVKPPMKQIADVKALTIKIESATNNRRPPSQQQAKRDPIKDIRKEHTDSNALNEKSTKVDSTATRLSNKSRNPRTQSTTKEVWISPGKPLIPPATTQAQSIAAPKMGLASNTTSSATSAAAVYGQRIEMRSHSQGSEVKRGPVQAKPGTARPVIKNKVMSPTKTLVTATKGATSARLKPSRNDKLPKHEPVGASGRTCGTDPNSRLHTNPTSKGSIEYGRSSSTKPTKTTAQTPRKATPTKGMPGSARINPLNKPKETANNPKSVPLSARNVYNATPTKMHIQVHSPPVVRPASSSGGNNTKARDKFDVKAELEKLKGANVLKIDLEELSKKRTKEVRKVVGNGHAHNEGGKKFRSEYLNALSSKQGQNTGEDHKTAIPKQGSAGDAPHGPAPMLSPNLNYSKSVETLEKGRENKSKAPKPELKRVESKPALSGFHNSRDPKKPPGLDLSKRAGAYYQQFLKVGSNNK